MRIWVRSAKIEPGLRGTFEQYGVAVMQQFLVNQDHVFIHDNANTNARRVGSPLLSWLTEQYDRAERKETFNLLMEIAILVFVGSELVIAALDFVSRRR